MYIQVKLVCILVKWCVGLSSPQKFAFHHSFFKGDSFADLEDDDGMFSRFFQVLASSPKLKTLEIVVGEQAYSGPIYLINPPRRSLPGPRIQAVSITSDENQLHGNN